MQFAVDPDSPGVSVVVIAGPFKAGLDLGKLPGFQNVAKADIERFIATLNAMQADLAGRVAHMDNELAIQQYRRLGPQIEVANKIEVP